MTIHGVATGNSIVLKQKMYGKDMDLNTAWKMAEKNKQKMNTWGLNQQTCVKRGIELRRI